MDRNFIKQVQTKRGFNYSYYFSPPAERKPVLLFLHGFPTDSYFWRKQIAFFQPKGYGLIVPDLLGYGGTDKPTDPKLYVGSGLAQDVVDILDKEGIDKVITVSNDWGTQPASRLANYYPNRLSAYAFLGLGYRPPADPAADPAAMSEMIKKAVGYDVGAYMQFFVNPDAPKIIERNFDSFFSLVFPSTPEVWKENLFVPGGAQAWIESGKVTSIPSYMTPEDKEHAKTSLLEGGLSAPLCWYKVQVEKANLEDDAKIPSTSHDLHRPLLFVSFTGDEVALPMFSDPIHEKHAKGPFTRKEVAGDHWAFVSHAEDINKHLLEWLEGVQ